MSVCRSGVEAAGSMFLPEGNENWPRTAIFIANYCSFPINYAAEL